MAKDSNKPMEGNPDVLPERVVVTEHDTNWDKVMPPDEQGILDAEPVGDNEGS